MKGLSSVLLVLFLGTTINLFAQEYHHKGYQPEFVKAKSVAELFVDINPFTDPTFFKIYAEYRAHQKREYRCSFLMLNNLALAAQIISEKEAFDCINSFLSYQQEERYKCLRKMMDQGSLTAALNFLSVDQNLNPSSLIAPNAYGLITNSPLK